MECAERGLIDAPWLRFGDAHALCARSTRSAARDGLGDLLAEGSRRAAETGRPGIEAFAPHVKGLELPATSRARCTRWRSASPWNARGADHNRSGAYEADSPASLDRLAGGDEHAARRDRDRGPRGVMDSLILCKFLRGVFDDPWREWAELLAPVTGWDVDETSCGDRPPHRDRQAPLQPPRGLDARRGQPAGALPDRAARARLRRAGDPHAERLTRMIDAYYDGRGLDRRRRPHPKPSRRARLDLFVQGPLSGARLRPWRSPLLQAARTVTLSIDGRELTVPEGTTIYDAAKSAGIEIPVLCHDERYDPVGVCRMCVVDVGARVYAAACVRPCEDGMEVKTGTPEVETAARPLTQL